MKDKLQQAAIIERQARSAGAQKVEVLLDHMLRREATTRRAAITAETTEALHLRVYVGDGQVGTASAAATTEEAVAEAIDQALAAARAAAPDPHAGPPPRLDIPTRGLGILDNRYPSIDDEARKEVLESNVESCAGMDAKVRVNSFVYEEVYQTRAYASTGNRPVVEDSTRYRLTGTAHHADAPRVRFTTVNASRNFAEVASEPIGVALGRRIRRTEKRATLPADPGPVIFSQEVVAELLPRILRAARAERMEAGHSFVHRHAGQQVASPELHVVDDGRLPGGFATRAFDDRGVPAIPITVLREGVLGGAYQGPESARAAHTDARPSGHETFDGGLWLGNLIVRPGNRSRNMLFPDLGVLAELEVLSKPPAVDPQGDRVTLTGHVWVRDAREEHGYAGVRTLSASIPALLGAVRHVCSDHERHGIVDTPTWILDGVWFKS